jgi:hypothetical protein
MTTQGRLTEDIEKIPPYLVPACAAAGAALLAVCSLLQKYSIGVDIFKPSGYVVPLLFGGGAGTAVGLLQLRVRNLNAALARRVEALETILPICANCKRIRPRDGDPRDMSSWKPVEEYIEETMPARLTHSICPRCRESIYGDLFGEDGG